MTAYATVRTETGTSTLRCRSRLAAQESRQQQQLAREHQQQNQYHITAQFEAGTGGQGIICGLVARAVCGDAFVGGTTILTS